MRWGLQKPGTVTFLALVIFSLLSLVPTLAKEWDFYSTHLAYLGLPRYHSRYSSSRVKNASIDTRSRGNLCKPWLFGDFYSSCMDSNAQPVHSVINVPLRSSFEVGPKSEKDPITYSEAKEPSSITRGVSAFKDFVIKRWDDQQTTQPLPPRHDFVDGFSSHPTPTLANLPVAFSSSNGQRHQLTPANEPNAAQPSEHSPEDSLLFRLPLFIHETWQQVCHTGGYYLEGLTTRPPTHHCDDQTLIPKSPVPAFTKEQTRSEHLQTQEQPQAERPPTRGSLLNRHNSMQADLPAGLGDTQHIQTSSPNPTMMTAGQSKYTGFGRDSEHMRGSSMAIVIGLVAGIMWF